MAFYVPSAVLEQVAEIKRLRTARHGGLEAREADIYREAVVRGLPLVLAAEVGSSVPAWATSPDNGNTAADASTTSPPTENRR